MKPTKHTPGPWRAIDNQTPRLIDGNEFFVRAANTEFIASSMNEPNARLIAAAPDMLELLLVCLNTVEEKMRERRSDTGYVGLVAALRQTIHKATGGAE